MRAVEKPWTKFELDFVQENASLGSKEIAKRLKRTPDSVRGQATRLNVKIAPQSEIKSQIAPEPKKEKPIQKNAPYTIMHTLPDGSKKIWIPSERAYITIPGNKDPQETVDKIVFRHNFQ